MLEELKTAGEIAPGEDAVGEGGSISSTLHPNFSFRGFLPWESLDPRQGGACNESRANDFTRVSVMPEHSSAAAAPALISVCTACGHSLAASSEPTRESAHAAASGLHEGKTKVFLPGTLLANRYRVVALLGSGGAGEVYRADDLILDQPVALKFYPRPLQGEPDAVARFHREVRLARQISHTNVCRVFDIGETEGRAFITMEFVSGEDLHSLLRRIGRLSPDKALEVALQLCSGLTAAHATGVMHRDLKPANVMLDDRGNVRITDFGLAAMANELHHQVDAGTPGYMAPEQLAGKEVTARSDLYALGLVLYEIFTGRRGIELQSAADLRRPERKAPDQQTLAGVNPWVRQAILQCLEPDPVHRPASALQVAATLARSSLPVVAEEVLPAPARILRHRSPERPEWLARMGWLMTTPSLIGFALLLYLAPISSGLGLDLKGASGTLGTAFTWMWGLAFQSFVALVAMFLVLRSGTKAGEGRPENESSADSE